MEPLEINERITIPAADLTFRAVRSGGPGGQNVNKTATKVDLRFDLPGTLALAEPIKERLRLKEGARLDAQGRLIVTSQATRDQARNLEDARDKLAALIRAALVRPKKRRPTKPSRGAKERRLQDKKQNAEKKKGRGRIDW